MDLKGKSLRLKPSRPTTARSTRSKTQRTSSVTFSNLLLIATSTVLFAVTTWFAASTFSERASNQANHILEKYLKFSFSSTVTVLRILQGLTSSLTSAAVAQSFEGIQWTLASGDRGIRLLNFLRLSPTTGFIGVLKLISGKQEEHPQRAWAALRLVSTAVLFVASVVLFLNTSSVEACKSVKTLNVLAGTGQFNGSFVEPFLQDAGGIVPYWANSATYNFVRNSVFSVLSRPISSSCLVGETQCDSYLFPGGTYLMYPPLSPQESVDSAVLIHSAPGTQIDFARGLDASDQFLAQDCVAYGNDGGKVGVEFCLAKSATLEGSLIAGIFACSNGIQRGKCLLKQPGPVPNVTTTMAVYNRKATTLCAASNNSILSVYDVGDAQLNFSVNITALHLAVGWLLNYTASGLPAESSITFWFWWDPSGKYNTIWESNSYTTLQSLLSFILWEFSTNNNGNPALRAETEANGGKPNLAAQFQTTASICQPYTKFGLSLATFVAYVILESAALLFCWAVVAWRCILGLDTPEISSYPLVDFASKLLRRPPAGAAHPVLLHSFIFPGTNDKTIKHALSNIDLVAACQDNDLAEPSRKDNL